MQAQKCQQNSYLCEQTLEQTVGRFAFRVVAEVESRLLRFPYVEKCLGVGETFTCPAGVAAPSGDWESKYANRTPHHANGRMLFSAPDGTNPPT